MPPQPTNPQKMPFEKYRPFLPLVLDDRTIALADRRGNRRDRGFGLE